MTSWWERFPERLEYELEALRKASIQFDEPIRDDRTGVLSLEVRMEFRGEQLRFRVEFPPFFPYVRFEIFAPELDLAHHQHPFSKNLCLLARSTTNWDMDDTVAGILTNQFPTLIQTVEEQDREAVAGMEVQQPEPFSEYYTYEKNSIVFVDSDWNITPSILRGSLQLAMDSAAPFRGSLIQIEDDQKNEIAGAKWFTDESRIIKGRWVRSDKEIRFASPEEILKVLKELDRRLDEPRWKTAFGKEIDVIGVLYPEETAWRATGNGWLFVVRQLRPGNVKGFRNNFAFDTFLVRAGRAGRSYLSARVPELAAVQEKRIVLIGCGALGGPIALECARSGAASLKLMDSDFVEPGNSVRWPLGFSAAGYFKAEALEKFIKDNYPSVEIGSWPLRFGAPFSLGGPQLAQYDDFFKGANLIIDCTAEVGLHYPLSEFARENKISYIAISATPGFWGGRIFRFIPGITEGCWVCLCNSLEEGRIPKPVGDPNGDIVPVGCAEPTFTGANYNALQISSFGVRFAVDALNQSPQFKFDLCNVAFKCESGLDILPSWTHYKIERHPKCDNH